MRLNVENRYYFTMKIMFSSKSLSRCTKERLYCRYMRPIVMYACQVDEEKLKCLERNILRKIYELVHNNNLKCFKRITNENLQQLYNKPSLRQFLVRKRLEWAGYDTLEKDFKKSQSIAGYRSSIGLREMAKH